MQEPIDHTEQKDNSTLPDYRPDEGTLHLFRRMGRIGIVISLFNIVGLAYQVYVALSYYRLMNRPDKYIYTYRLRKEYSIRFYCLVLSCLAILFTLIMLFRASRSLLQYGNDHDNMDLQRPAKHLYTWFIYLLINVMVNAAYVTYVFLSQKGLYP